MNITVSDDNKLNVPNHTTVGYIEGDGIGPEITASMIKVVNSAVELAYSGEKSIEWHKIIIGREAYERYGRYIPDISLEEIKKIRVIMKSTLNFLPDRSNINVLLRQKLGLYANVRVIRYLPGISVMIKNFERLYITVIRDSVNNEITFNYSSEKTRDLINFMSENYDINISQDSALMIISQSRFRAKMAKLAAEYYNYNRKNRITIVYSRINPEFPEWCREEILKLNPSPDVEIMELTEFIGQIIDHPENFDMVLLDNYSNRIILSFLVNSVNIEYGGSFGDGIAFFEAIQGSAPQDAGYDVADPISFIMSGSMMLKYLGWEKSSEIIENAVHQTFIENKLPKDLADREHIEPVKCSEFADEIIKRMKM
ncbi:isocitrate/isopropylmalate family dehydrogenase [Acidiplasma cupricumulans]|uniref:isocitrate/isopropylmalate family dehydrogenase n=1 Tax=Acidiplasma cupricumulans TaxID=312540 RepID=UPI000780F080|nr:isocitrate/isopropylmalate family dehydrogenase [Acidiplasma cupricumulans]